jgi:hypothetical protein
LFFFSSILIALDKILGIWIPDEYSLVQIICFASNSLVLLGHFIHRRLNHHKKDIKNRILGLIICWSLNEANVVIAFVMTLTQDLQNGFFIMLNLTLSLFGNLITFPKK